MLKSILWASVGIMGLGFSAFADHEGVMKDCYSPEAISKVNIHRGGYSCVVGKVKSGTVSIVVHPKIDPKQPPGAAEGGRGGSGGSGFFVSSDGYVVTNNHVVDGGDPKNTEYEVYLVGEKESLKAQLIGADEEADLAVLKVDLKGKKVKHLHWADLKDTQVGDPVIAIGSPFGLNFTVTYGYISAFRGMQLDNLSSLKEDQSEAEKSDVIQTDASVNSGNSGGALINILGDVVGVNQMIFSKTGENAGIAFAISASHAKDTVQELIEKGHVVRGWLGISLSVVPEGEEKAWKLEKTNHPWVVVRKVYVGGPADEHLREGDVITAVNGQAITDPNVLKLAISKAKPGSYVVLDVVHKKGAKKDSVKVQIEDRANMPEEIKQEIAKEQAELKRRQEEEQQRQMPPGDPRGMLPPGMGGPGDEGEGGPMLPPGQGQLPPGSPFDFEQQPAPAKPKKEQSKPAQPKRKQAQPKKN